MVKVVRDLARFSIEEEGSGEEGGQEWPTTTQRWTENQQ